MGASVFVAVHRFGVHMIYGDRRSDGALLRHAHDGTLSAGTLGAQHNENRILVPSLIELLLGDTTRYQVVVEDFPGAAALCATTALLILAHRGGPRAHCGSPTSRWRWPCRPEWSRWMRSPPSISPGSWCCRRRPPRCTWPTGPPRRGWGWPPRWPPRRSAASPRSSSPSLQGLLIWPAVLVVRWLRGRSPVTPVVSTGNALVAGGNPLAHFDVSRTVISSGSSTGIGGLLRFAVAELGDVVGDQPTSGELVAVGIAVLVAVAVAGGGGFAGCGRGSRDGRPAEAALMVFGLLFMAASAGPASDWSLPCARPRSP